MLVIAIFAAHLCSIKFKGERKKKHEVEKITTIKLSTKQYCFE